MPNTRHALSDEERDKWDTREVGAQEEHVRAVTSTKGKEIDKNLGLEPITVRLQSDLIESLRESAHENGLEYHTYIRHVLTEHVSEKNKNDAT